VRGKYPYRAAAMQGFRVIAGLYPVAAPAWQDLLLRAPLGRPVGLQ